MSTEKKIEQYLPYYIGQKLERGGVITHSLLEAANNAAFDAYSDLKPLLSKLEDMPDEDILHLVWLNMDSEKHLEPDSRISKDELIIEVRRIKGNSITVDVSCRCFEGIFYIFPNGDLRLIDEDRNNQDLENQSTNFHYLLKKGYDLFGLIDAGLAVDRKTLKQ